MKHTAATKGRINPINLCIPKCKVNRFVSSALTQLYQKLLVCRNVKWILELGSSSFCRSTKKQQQKLVVYICIEQFPKPSGSPSIQAELVHFLLVFLILTSILQQQAAAEVHLFLSSARSERSFAHFNRKKMKLWLIKQACKDSSPLTSAQI